jgi:hypothetical protein
VIVTGGEESFGLFAKLGMIPASYVEIRRELCGREPLSFVEDPPQALEILAIHPSAFRHMVAPLIVALSRNSPNAIGWH